MKTRAVSMVLLIIASALAGCTSGDPDGDGEMGIDTDVLNQMIEDNLQDFINNSSVTVHHTVHQHNNTTVVNNYYQTTNEYQNTTNVEEGEIGPTTNYYQSNNSWNMGGNGSNSGAILHAIDFEFTLNELWGNSEIQPGDRNNTYTVTWTYYDYNTNQERTDIFTFPCSSYYLVGSANTSNLQTYWDDSSHYEQAWSDNGYNSTMRDIMHHIAWDENLRFTCDESFFGYSNNPSTYSEIIYTITVPQGFAFSCESHPSYSLYQDNGNYIWFSGQSENKVYLYADGLFLYDYHCENKNQYFGNGESFEVIIWNYNLMEDTQYRLLFHYSLVPVVTVE